MTGLQAGPDGRPSRADVGSVWRSLVAGAIALETWLGECREYAADPDGWMERRRGAVRRLMAEESDRTADPRS